MLELIVGFLGWCLLIAICFPLWVLGTVAFSRHHQAKCRCSGCQRKRDRVQDQYQAQFRPAPGEVLRSMEEWEQVWESE